MYAAPPATERVVGGDVGGAVDACARRARAGEQRSDAATTTRRMSATRLGASKPWMRPGATGRPLRARDDEPPDRPGGDGTVRAIRACARRRRGARPPARTRRAAAGASRRPAPRRRRPRRSARRSPRSTGRRRRAPAAADPTAWRRRSRLGRRSSRRPQRCVRSSSAATDWRRHSQSGSAPDRSRWRNAQLAVPGAGEPWRCTRPPRPAGLDRGDAASTIVAPRRRARSRAAEAQPAGGDGAARLLVRRREFDRRRAPR
jgi:hypothetical protein